MILSSKIEHLLQSVRVLHAGVHGHLPSCCMVMCGNVAYFWVPELLCGACSSGVDMLRGRKKVKRMAWRGQSVIELPESQVASITQTPKTGRYSASKCIKSSY